MKRLLLASLVIFLGLPMLAMEGNGEGWESENKTTPLEEQFIRAVQYGRNDEARELPLQKVNVNAKNALGYSALWFAARNGSEELCTFLINHHADVNTKNTRQTSALMAAATHGHVTICRMLIQNGANVHARDSKGSSALIFASMFDHEEICVLLLEHGADANLQTYEQYNALWYAAANGSFSVCKLLLQYGVNPELIIKNEMKAIDLAREFHAMYLADEDEEAAIKTHFIIELLSDPEKIRAVVLDPKSQNPKMRKLFKSNTNVYQAIQNRELGLP